MAAKAEVRFEEAENKKGIILTATAAILTPLAWLVRGSPIVMGAVVALTVYLMTGDRYQWVYIWKKTFRRDMLGIRVLFNTIFRIWLWEKTGTTVTTRFAELVKKHPDKKAFIMDDRSLTFRQGDELSNRIAWYFKRQGFKSGEVIAVFMETQPEYVFIWLGLAKLRVITALVNTNLRGSQLIHCLRIAGCKAIIFGDGMAEAIKEIQSQIRDIPLFQFNSDKTSAILQDTAPLATELNEMNSNAFDIVPASPRDTLMYIYTSGTTGLPKAAIITNLRYLLIPLGSHNSARLSPEDIVYDPLPLHHSAGGVLGAGQAIVFGCTVVLRKKFSASNYWNDAAKYECTAAQYIGEMCRYILAVAPSAKDKAHKVKTILGNGLRPQIWEEFVERFGVKKVVEFYGATEGNSNLINLDSKVGAIGFLSRMVSSVYPLSLVRCDELTGEILRDGDGRCIPCGPHEPGLLLGKIDPKKAILNFSGYADKTASEKKMVRNVRFDGDCYFNTGDILVMDHFGYFYFKDRTGDTFRWRGENVSTAEVEGIISSLVGLKDAIVYGVAAHYFVLTPLYALYGLADTTGYDKLSSRFQEGSNVPYRLPQERTVSWASSQIPNVEGKAGMASIADPDHKLDLNHLAKGLKSLAAYARPLFIRILPQPPLTATFKLKKKELLEEGYNPSIVTDPLYFLDQKTGEYVELTNKLYDDIVQGVVRL